MWLVCFACDRSKAPILIGSRNGFLYIWFVFKLITYALHMFLPDKGIVINKFGQFAKHIEQSREYILIKILLQRTKTYNQDNNF